MGATAGLVERRISAVSDLSTTIGDARRAGQFETTLSLSNARVQRSDHSRTRCGCCIVAAWLSASSLLSKSAASETRVGRIAIAD